MNNISQAIGKNRIFPLIIALVLIVLPFVTVNPYFLHIIIMVLFYAYCSSSWNIIGGFAGQLSYGHSAFIAIGAYAVGLLYKYLNLTPWIGMIIGGLIAAAIAVFIGIPTFRLRGAYYAISTIAFSEGFRVILETVKSVGSWEFGGAQGFMMKSAGGNSFVAMQFNSKIPYYFIILIMLVLVVLLSKYIERSKLGYYLSAIKEDQEAALALGINAQRIKLVAAAISAFATALGGAFYLQLIRYIEPTSIASNVMSDQLVFFAVVGGIGTVGGPILGAIILTAIGEVARTYFTSMPGLHLLIYGIVMILVIEFCPHGILEPLQKLITKTIKKITKRQQKAGDNLV